MMRFMIKRLMTNFAGTPTQATVDTLTNSSASLKVPMNCANSVTLSQIGHARATDGWDALQTIRRHSPAV